MVEYNLNSLLAKFKGDFYSIIFSVMGDSHNFFYYDFLTENYDLDKCQLVSFWYDALDTLNIVFREVK